MTNVLSLAAYAADRWLSAGGGAELGGVMGMMPYHQRTGVQAATLDMLAGI